MQLLARILRLSRKALLSPSFRERNRDFATGKSASKFCSPNGQERAAAASNFVLGQCKFKPHFECRWSAKFSEKGGKKENALSIARKGTVLLCRSVLHFSYTKQKQSVHSVFCPKGRI